MGLGLFATYIPVYFDSLRLELDQGGPLSREKIYQLIDEIAWETFDILEREFPSSFRWKAIPHNGTYDFGEAYSQFHRMSRTLKQKVLKDPQFQKIQMILGEIDQFLNKGGRR